MTLTRRGLFGTIAGLATTLNLKAVAPAKDAIQHKLLRRPYTYQETGFQQPGWLWDSLMIQVRASAPVRIKLTDGMARESVLEVTVVPNLLEYFKLTGLHKRRAEHPITVDVSSSKPFEVLEITANWMLPAFRRVNGMIVYHDPFYKPHPDHGFGSTTKLLTFKRGPAAKDVQY